MAAPAAAQEQEASADPSQADLRLADAVLSVVEASPAVGEARWKKRAAESSRQTASAARLPALRLTGAYRRMKESEPLAVEIPSPDGSAPGGSTAGASTTIELGDEIANSYSLGLELNQPLFTGGRMKYNVERSAHLAQAARERESWSESSVALEATTAYWELIRADARVEAIAQRLEQVTANVRDMERRLEQGVVTRNAVLEATMRRAEVRARLTEARNGRRLARARLNLLMGRAADRAIEPSTALPQRVEPLEERRRVTERAFARRGDVAAAEQRIDAGKAAARMTRAGWYPNLALTGSMDYARPNPQSAFPTDEFELSWHVGVALEIDIGGYPALSHRIDARAADVEAARERLRGLRREVELAVTKAHLELQSAADRVEAADALLEQAEENYRTVRQKREQGLALNTELLGAGAQRLEARMKRSMALVDQAVAHARLRHAEGTLLEWIRSQAQQRRKDSRSGEAP
jgi:outer membrane protein TolC